MKKYILLFISFIIIGVAYADVKQIGTPRVKNYPNTIYHAGTQSWGIDVGPNGMVYFANNECVLEFDGVEWRQYPLPELTVVRSVYAADDGNVYAGGFNEFGFFQADSTGDFKFCSLQRLLQEKDRDFEDVWKIYPLDDAVVFQSFSQLMIYENGAVTVIPAPHAFHFSYLVNDKLYVNDTESGLLYFDGNALHQMNGMDELNGKLVWSVMPFGSSELLIATDGEGIYRYNGESLTVWDNPVSDMLMKEQVFCGVQISDKEYAFGTILNGLFICNDEGELLQHINIEKGLLNNTILSITLDQYDNLWLGLDNGIDYVGINSPLTYFSDFNNLSSGYAAVIHDGYIYFGTNQGVFYSDWSNLNNANGEHDFNIVPGTHGQVWSLKVIDGTLFCGHNSGTFIIDGTEASLISDVQGGWTFSQPPGSDDIIIGGTYFGLVKFQRINEAWEYVGMIEGFEESSRYMFMDDPYSIWVSHGYKGVYHISLDDDYNTTENIDFYTTGRGFPDDDKLTLNNIGGEPVFTSGNHIYRFEPRLDTFLLHAELEKRLGFTEISTLTEDSENNIWYFTPGDMGVFRKKEDGSYTHVSIPFSELKDGFIKWFQAIYPYDDENIFIGTQSGFVHYSANYNRDYNVDFNTYIRNVKIIGGVDSVVYQGYRIGDERVDLPFRYRNLHFDFSANDFENQNMVTYLTMLDDFDDDWVNNGNVPSRQFTNLRQGDYTFHVKALNAWGVESNAHTFSFHINAPWYLSIIAYISYLLILMLAIYLFIRYTLNSIRVAQQRFKEQQEREFATRSRQMQIENLKAEKEVIRLRNDKLRSEKKAKDMELANTTMQIIQTSKALASLKTDLKMLSKELGDHSASGRLNRILKKVDRNIDSDKQWEVFEKHFTGVHEAFLNRMKADFPDLSPREMKLCAYLRLNISSKEIADLMNISVRGVEISRYRLRKKLQLDHDQNLTDFIVKY